VPLLIEQWRENPECETTALHDYIAKDILDEKFGRTNYTFDTMNSYFSRIFLRFRNEYFVSKKGLDAYRQ
jgi:hypothetical protein